MNENEKVDFYDLNQQSIHLTIKSNVKTKPLWRRLYWTTGKDSDEYKAGCVDILKAYFPDSFQNLIHKASEKAL